MKKLILLLLIIGFAAVSVQATTMTIIGSNYPYVYTTPSASVVDNFNRTENPLTTSNWYNRPWSASPGDMKTTGAVAQVASTATFSGACWKGISSVNQEVIMPLTTLPASGDQVMLLTRHDWATHTGYELEIIFRSGGTAEARIYRWDSSTTIPNITPGGYPYYKAISAISAGDLIAVQVIGTRIIGWLYHGGSWSHIIEVGDGKYTSAGLACFGAYELYSSSFTTTEFKALSLD